MSFRSAFAIAPLLTLALACSASSRDSNKAAGGDGGVGTPGSIVGPDDAGQDGGGDCAQNIDIVFVMDVSTSMDGFLNKLAQEMPVVDQKLKAISPVANPYYGLAVFVDDAMLLNNGNPFQNVDSLKQEFEKWAKFAKGNSELSGNGSNMTYPENSLDALYAAADGFHWRPGSLRIVIHTTDDTFWNGPTTQDGVNIQHSYPATVKKLIDTQVRDFSYASKLGGSDETTDVSMGWFGPYQGQDSIPKATFGDVYELADVVSGKVSLANSIEKLVQDTFCKPYAPVK